jgi:hypothetical protein
MKTSKDFADLLQMIQDKRNHYQRHGTPYDNAEEMLKAQKDKAELEKKLTNKDEPETNDTREP